MKQPHTETGIDHTDDQQNTGNHAAPDNPQGGADKFGGTRAGAENVEGGKMRSSKDNVDDQGKPSSNTKPDSHG